MGIQVWRSDKDVQAVLAVLDDHFHFGHLARRPHRQPTSLVHAQLKLQTPQAADMMPACRRTSAADSLRRR